MLRHVVLFRLHPETSSERRDALVDALDALPAQIPEIRSFEVAADEGLRDGSWDVGVVALFDDEAGWRTYLDHPAHVSVVDDHVRPLVAERASVQLMV
jgi:hypothetical protein